MGISLRVKGKQCFADSPLSSNIIFANSASRYRHFYFLFVVSFTRCFLLSYIAWIRAVWWFQGTSSLSFLYSFYSFFRWNLIRASKIQNVRSLSSFYAIFFTSSPLIWPVITKSPRSPCTPKSPRSPRSSRSNTPKSPASPRGSVEKEASSGSTESESLVVSEGGNETVFLLS